MEILITGGLGDFFAVECVMTDVEKKSVRKIHLATPSAKFILQAISYHQYFSSVEIINHFTPEEISQNTSSKYCIHSIVEMNQVLKKMNRIQLSFAVVRDFSILKIFPEIRSGTRRYQSHAFNFPRVVCDIVVDTESPNDFRMKNRSFTQLEIELVKKYAADRETIFLDVRNNSFEFFVSRVLGCREFVGIDSAASVLAAIDKKENFPQKKIFVRSRNPVWYKNRACWYATTDFSFSESFNLGVINDK